MTLALAFFFAPGKWHSIFAEWPPKKMPLKLKIRHWPSAPHSTVLASNLESSRCYWSQEFQWTQLTLQGGYKLEEKQKQDLALWHAAIIQIGWFFSYDSLVVRIRHPHSLHHLNQLMVDFGGLGPGVLDSWDSLMKGIVLLLRVNARIWNHQTNPNHQIYHWLIGIQSQKNKVFRIRPASKHYSTNMCCPSWNNNFLRPGNRGRQNLWRNLGAWKCMFL